jgi:anti-sigma regulatory factor (Ser/Thr protein kinase)
MAGVCIHRCTDPTGPRPGMQRRARRFAGRPEHIRAARRFVAAALAAWPATQEAALLLVSEVVTNAILHSASGDHGGSLEVRYALDDHEVYVEVVDAGGSARPRRYAQYLEGVSGRGLALVEALASGWGMHDHHGGHVVWCRLPLRMRLQ